MNEGIVVSNRNRSAQRSIAAEEQGVVESTREGWLRLVIVTNGFFWLANAIHEWIVRGPFVVVGGDWARFWGATRAFSLVSPASGYHLPAIASYMQPLNQYVQSGVGGTRAGPAPYPPIFLKLFALFTLPAPLLGFLLWTLLNVVIAVIVLRRLAGRFRTRSPWILTLVMLTSFPLMMALFVGQVVVLLLACVAQAVSEFERGRELQAGFWMGLLVIKPQYAFCIALVLLFKRRTAAIAGFGIGVSAILVGSLVAGGVTGLTAYGRMLVTSYPSYGGGTGIDPHGQLGWRSLVLTAFPHLSTGLSLALVALLSLLTLALLPFIWRGPWEPTGVRFPRQLAATLAVTLLVAYHSQPHGAVLLLVPASLVVAQMETEVPRIVRRLIVVAMAGTPVLGLFSALAVGNLSLVTLAINVVLIGTLCVFGYMERERLEMLLLRWKARNARPRLIRLPLRR